MERQIDGKVLCENVIHIPVSIVWLYSEHATHQYSIRAIPVSFGKGGEIHVIVQSKVHI